MTAPSSAVKRSASTERPDLESELREAVADLERGDYITLTPEQVETWATTGELPWPDESDD